MKTILKYFLWGISFTVVTLVCVAAIVAWRGRVFLNEHKGEFVSRADAFANCIQTSPSDSCWDSYFSENAKKHASKDGFKTFVEKVKTNLGDRIKSELIEKTLKWTTYAGSNGMVTTIVFSMNADYAKDFAASENFTLTKQGDGPFLIEGYQVNSDKMLK